MMEGVSWDYRMGLVPRPRLVPQLLAAENLPSGGQEGDTFSLPISIHLPKVPGKELWELLSLKYQPEPGRLCPFGMI